MLQFVALVEVLVAGYWVGHLWVVVLHPCDALDSREVFGIAYPS